MAEHDLHALAAAYALDALDEVEEREFEQHLRTCARCREELRGLLEAASALAYAPEAPAPPASLRAQIMSRARAERPNVIPLRPRRRGVYLTGAVAAVAAAVALGLGLWANSVTNSRDRDRQVLQILADPSAQSTQLRGADGRLVVTPSGEAALVVAGLNQAPSGKTYEAWVIEGKVPARAGLFEGEKTRDVVRLTRRVPPGAIVAVTIEVDGGVDQPTGRILFTATPRRST
jgi:anti-sigma-K factor RskA